MPSFLGVQLRGVSCQPAFFLVGSRTTVAFGKEGFKKGLACLAKRFSSTEMKFRT